MHRGFCSPEFEAATDYVQLQVQLGESRFSEATLQLEFYGLYKQSLCGPVIDKQPSIFQIKERAKWFAFIAKHVFVRFAGMHGKLSAN